MYVDVQDYLPQVEILQLISYLYSAISLVTDYN